MIRTYEPFPKFSPLFRSQEYIIVLDGSTAPSGKERYKTQTNLLMDSINVEESWRKIRRPFTIIYTGVTCALNKRQDNNI